MKHKISRKFHTNNMFWWGIFLFAIGILPILVIIGISKIGIGDPNPNPIGLGFMAITLGPIGFVLIFFGLIQSILDYFKSS